MLRLIRAYVDRVYLEGRSNYFVYILSYLCFSPFRKSSEDYFFTVDEKNKKQKKKQKNRELLF